MAALTWVGGGNNNANNPQDWSPAQAPAPGDTLTMPSGTMNISDNDLQGNTLQVDSSSSPTDINLSDDANVSITQPLITNGAQFGTIIESKGTDTLTLDAPTGSAPIMARTFNIDIELGNLTGSFSTDYSTISINGNGKLTNGNSTFAGSSAVIDTDVVGQGSFDVTALPSFGGLVDDGSLEFGDKVGGGETVTVGHTITSFALQWDNVKIDQPRDFHGSLAMEPRAEVDLVGLGKADSYILRNDKLEFISDNHVIDTLKLTNESSTNMLVSTNGNDAYVTEQGLSSPPSGSVTLPQVTAADFANILPPKQHGTTVPDSTYSSLGSVSYTGDPTHIVPPLHPL